MTALPTFSSLGSGPIILMLHGIGGGHRAFAPQVETFASLGYRAVAWDMPGYGRSAPIEPYTFKGLAQSCIALIEALLGADDERRRAEHGGSVILLGHSMGAMVAQEVVARRPELVNRLILCGTSPSFGKPDGDWQRDFIAQRTAPLDAGQTMADLAAVLVPQMIGPGSLPEGVALATRCMAGVHPPAYRKALEAIVTFDRRAALPLIRVPTLLVAGEFDRNAPPAVMQKMAGQIAGSRSCRAAGHRPPAEPGGARRIRCPGAGLPGRHGGAGPAHPALSRPDCCCSWPKHEPAPLCCWPRTGSGTAAPSCHACTCLRPPTPRAGPGFRPARATPFFGYGYQFWLYPLTTRTFALQGIHGQTIYVQPASGIVMVQTAVFDQASGRTEPEPHAERDALWRGVLATLGGSLD